MVSLVVAWRARELSQSSLLVDGAMVDLAEMHVIVIKNGGWWWGGRGGG